MKFTIIHEKNDQYFESTIKAASLEQAKARIRSLGYNPICEKWQVMDGVGKWVLPQTVAPPQPAPPPEKKSIDKTTSPLISTRKPRTEYVENDPHPVELQIDGSSAGIVFISVPIMFAAILAQHFIWKNADIPVFDTFPQLRQHLDLFFSIIFSSLPSIIGLRGIVATIILVLFSIYINL